jgi:NAD(P)-dependent dehydrogenase (short-subunit alcohol dehydrogenase family)
MRLRGKVAVITGAGSGIGLTTAARFATEGAALVLGDWNTGRLDAAVAGIRAGGGTVAGAPGDIADRATAEGPVDLAFSTHGRLDVLVNNAGVMDHMQGVGEVADDVWRRVLGINLDGPMFTMRRAVPRMLERGGGAIVNVASTAGIRGGAAGAYAALIPATLDPEDIAALVLFLASDEARRVNGAIIPADAGWTAA